MPGKHQGFRSRRQWRWAFASGQSFARRWAHETPGGPGKRYRNLPARAKGRDRRSRVRKAGSLHTWE